MAIDLNFHGLMKGPETLQGTAQTLSGGWADLGDEIDTRGVQNLRLWLLIYIQNSTDVRVRMLVKLEEDGADEFVLPIDTETAAVITVQDEYIEFNDDVTQNMSINWELRGNAPFVQFQVQAGTVGATPGSVTAYVTASHY